MICPLCNEPMLYVRQDANILFQITDKGEVLWDVWDTESVNFYDTCVVECIACGVDSESDEQLAGIARRVLL